MTGHQLDAASTAVASQKVTLDHLRGLFDQIDIDLNEVFARESRVSDGLQTTGAEMEALRAQLLALGITPRAEPRSIDTPADRSAGAEGHSRYAVPSVDAGQNFDQIARSAATHLEGLDIDLSRDPLQQVLPDSQIAASLHAFTREHGDVDWNSTDWTVVMAAGLIASLLDVVLVRIPQDTAFLGAKQSGSPLTAWLKDKDRATAIHSSYFRQFEKLAKVPYDAPTSAATGGLVAGMRPVTHRLQSFGHDPVLGFIVGIADIMHGTGTYLDKSGNIVQVAVGGDPVDLISALITQVRHVLSDVYTPAGLPAPLFSMLQLGTVDSPFALGASGAKVPWTDVSRYMYTHGYDLRHCFAMGIVPGTIEAVIRGYWLLDSYAKGGDAAQRKREALKLRSMLLLGHSLATSGTLIKTGALFGMNPLALNYPQILAMAPASIAWIRESAAREKRISKALDATWRELTEKSAV